MYREAARCRDSHSSVADAHFSAVVELVAEDPITKERSHEATTVEEGMGRSRR